jgi:ATP-dependent Lon protease
MLPDDQPRYASADDSGASQVVKHPSDADGQDKTPHDPNSGQGFVVPVELPIIPLRGMVVFPQTLTPLMVGQPRSVRLVDDVAAGDRLVGLIASKDADNENPGPDDLVQIGTVGAVHRLFRAPDGTIRL